MKNFILSKVSVLLTSATLVLVTACGSSSFDSHSQVAGSLDQNYCGFRSPEREADPKLAQIEADIAQRVNAFRRANGLKNLVVHSCITSVAYFHSENMARKASMSHVLDGKDAARRLADAQIGIKAWGENIHSQWETRNGRPSWNHATYAAAAMTSWLNSPPHRANILSPRFTHLGVGVAKGTVGTKGYFYATQVFLAQ